MLRALSRKVPVFVEMNVRKGIRSVGNFENELLEGRQRKSSELPRTWAFFNKSPSVRGHSTRRRVAIRDESAVI